MQMTANLPDSPLILEAVLEGFVQAAAAEIAAGIVPPFPDPPLRYVEESEGQERWKLPHEVLADGQGDCEDLCFWEAAGMRVLGEDPTATVRLVKTGFKKLHAIVLRSDGSISDPSARLKAAYAFANRNKKLTAAERARVSGVVGCVGGDCDEWDLGAVRVIARGPSGAQQRTDGKGLYVRPTRDPAKSRPFTPPTNQQGWRDVTGQTLSETQLYDRQLRGEQKRFGQDPAQQGYYPPGYMPPGMYPYEGYPPYPMDYMMQSPMAYGSPYSGQPMYGFSGDYWGTGGDSPYGWVWGGSEVVTYEDLYGPSGLPQANPYGISEDDDGEYAEEFE